MKYFKTPNNQIFAYEADGSQDHLVTSDMVQITKQEVELINADKAQQNFDGLSYSDKRATEYPSIADQLDTLYHGGYDVWKAQVQAIKDKYPKA